MKQHKAIAPDYPRIPHLVGSNTTHDDITSLNEIEFPCSFYVSEKIDGSNCRIAWQDGPVLGNRTHILRKGYMKDTPAKIQFRSAWNYVHDHELDIKIIEKEFGSKITIYGEYCYALHSLNYNKLPDYFIAYDIWSVDDHKFLSPDKFTELISKTSIKYVKNELKTFNSFNEIIKESERLSTYRDGIVEGVVLKISTKDNMFTNETFKFVNSKFIRREDFNTTTLIKNTLLKNK